MAEARASLYLSHLKFDPKLKQGVVAKLLGNTRLLILVILTLALAGTLAFTSLPRELNPEIKLAIVNIVTTLPGASAADVEQLVTKEIEQSVGSLPNIDIMTSSSSDSISVITIQFLGNEDPDTARDAVKERVDRIRNELPDNVTDPRVEKLDFNDQPVWQVSVHGDKTPRELSLIAQDLQDSIENERSVDRVVIVGEEQRDVVVEVTPATLRTVPAALDVIAGAIRANALKLPAGSVEAHNLVYSVTIDNEALRAEDLRTIPVDVNGTTIPLGELANIYEKARESDQRTTFRKPGEEPKNAIELAVYKSDDASITDAYEAAKRHVDALMAEDPSLQQSDVLNFARETDDSFADLQNNFISSVVLVFFALTVFLGARQALIAAISLPLTLMSTFLIMQATGISMNFLATFSLLLALSLVGDDAIVIVQSNKQYQQKFAPFEAMLLVFRDYFIPIWTGTITVVWSFVPLLLASGIIGKFIRPIPIVVSATLLSSTAIATLINLPLNAVFAELQLPKRVRVLLGAIAVLTGALLTSAAVKGSLLSGVVLLLYGLALVFSWLARKELAQLLRTLRHRVRNRRRIAWRPRHWPHWLEAIIRYVVTHINTGKVLSDPLISIDPLAKRYQQTILAILPVKRRRLMVYGVVLGAVVLSIVFAATGLLKNEFFPKTDYEYLYVHVETPAGTTLTETQARVREVETTLLELPEVEHLFTTVGQGTSDGFSSGASGSNQASLTLQLVKKEERRRSSIDVAESLRHQFASYREATVRVVEQSGGPPAGADLQVNVLGDDLAELERITNEFADVVKEVPGAVDVKTTLQQSPGQVHVDLRPHDLVDEQLTPAQVGTWLRAALSGNEVLRLRSGKGDDTPVIVRLPDENQTLDQIAALTMRTPSGAVSIGDVADLRLENSPVSIVRENGKRVVRVQAAAGKGTTAPTLLREFQSRAKDIKLPEGYSWNVGGVNDENAKSVQSILRAMLVSVILILVTMVLLLKSFRQAFMVLAVIPLAVAGVFINFTIFQIPLSFPALIGVLALFGIVVNNAIMLMDKMNQNLAEGFPFYEALADATASRIEPILLSSLTGILGLLPITISDPLWRGLGGAIVAGLSVSGFLVVFLLPAMYVDVFKGQYLTHARSTRQV